MSNSVHAFHLSDADVSPTFGAQYAKSFARFLVGPFRLVLAMQPQREREAARIVEQFGCDRWSDALEQRIGEQMDPRRGS
jgi:hypothetical protein